MTDRPTTNEAFAKRWGSEGDALVKAIDGLDAGQRVLILRDALGLYERLARRRVDELQSILNNPEI